MDKISPEVVRTVPSTGETNVNPEIRVQIWFSERVKSSTVSDAVYVTPFAGEEIRYKWKGKKLEIIFPQRLKSNCTYVINLGTTIQDYRNNAMKSTSTLAFSTGPILDQGEITGRIYVQGDARGIGVWAYCLEDTSQSDPRRKEPDYAVQCEEDGSFQFTHLSAKPYRLFAVRDRASDRLYLPGEDEAGVTFRDVNLSGEKGTPDSLFFRIAREDTIGPSLVRAVSLDQDHLLLQFDRVLSDRNKIAPGQCVVVSEEDTLKELPVLQVYLDYLNPKNVYMKTARQTAKKRYRVTVSGLIDLSGLFVDFLGRQTQFEGTDRPDTTRPKLVFSEPKDGEKSVDLDIPLRFVFDRGLDTLRFFNGFMFKDTLGLNVEGVGRWLNPAHFMFYPKNRMKSLTHYVVILSGKGITDPAGNAFVDTSIRFQTLNEDTLSEISGSVVDPDTGARGKIMLTARLLGEPRRSYEIQLPGPMEYRFDHVLPGQYVLECFRDEDGDDQFSPGHIFPYQPSERFSVYPDTIKIRSRWPNEGNRLRLP